ncbi:zinc transporter ZntB [Pseudidiomarina aquimaris]|uniref:Zinc transporter ZntB n=1 Tax=Pseudidiomarina aquimaris TaxID=641841 RepID=A0A432XFY4_9GAMM|nr:CorA family divalent cation transporter [Pseudidiomarina aquimaris]RUO47668.1 zinc transporter ZntB [Pseudidiomarina aquimaris]
MADEKRAQRPDFMIDSWDFSSHPAQPITHDLQGAPQRWFHIQRDLPGIEAWLSASGIPAPLIDAVLEEDTRPRFERNDDGFLLILRGVNLAEGERPEDMLSLRILYYKGAIYSFRKRAIRSVGVIRERLQRQEGPESLNDFLVTLIEEMNNRLEELLDVIEDEMELLEDDDRGTTAERQRQLTALHRRMLRLVRFVRPQLTALERLGVDAPKWLEPDNVQWLINERDAIQRELESLEMLLEQVWMLREHLQQEVAEKMNRNTYWLSMVAGVFLPISFLTGVFGINIGGMPGVEHANAFWIFCGALGVIAVVEFLLLRRLRFW